ncbi:MAG: helix-turn-helix domain-containing protein [Spirulinaceae cyanobacterium]
MRRAIKVRIYPTTEQKQSLARQFGCARSWWNKALSLQYEQLQLKEREWTCESCQTKLLRDENAAKNIRQEGMRIIGLGHNSPHGDGVRLQKNSEATVCEVSTTPVA